MSATSEFISLVILVVFISSGAIHGAIVSYVTTMYEYPENHRNGSTEGGTLLWVFGSGFAPNEFSMTPSDTKPNEVKLVRGSSSYDCSIMGERMSDTQIACYTPPTPPGSYQVRVYVDNVIIPLSQHSSIAATTYESSLSNTPIIHNISPTSGPARRLVTLEGDLKSKCYLRDERECLEPDAPFITRIYIGGQMCNLIDWERDGYYSEMNYTHLQCYFESDDVGIFNVTMLVSNDYGRSKVDSGLFRLSGTGQVYNFETFAVIRNISTNVGSMEGGTILTIEGDHFCDSEFNPLKVNVGDDPCEIISREINMIRCQASSTPSNNRINYRGGRGFHMYRENVFTNLRNLGNAGPPMPGSAANKTWTEQASITGSFPSAVTVWFIGYVRPPIEAAYTFRLHTNGQALLFLSTNEDPTNMRMIANDSRTDSSRIVLQGNTDYYLFCVGSIGGGNFYLSINTAIQPVNARMGLNIPGTSEVQMITIGSNVVSEHQQISYASPPSSVPVSEQQDVEALLDPFQIGFEGAYTGILDGPPTPQYIQDSLNDLPTIYPETVTVALVGTSYRVTFPASMGDVPPLRFISTANNQSRTAIEIVQGVSSNAKIAFELDGMITSYMDFQNNAVTSAILTNEFQNLFSIKCPPSLVNQAATPSIIYAEDFEQLNNYDDQSELRDVAFCGRGSMKTSTQQLVFGNSLYADFMCFAYKVAVGNLPTLNLLMENDGNPPVMENIPINLQVDGRWHYLCFNLRDTLEQFNPLYMAVTTFIVREATMSQFTSRSVMIDAVSLRSNTPIGYEDEATILETDRSNVGRCRFPFTYQGKSYSTCILDNNKIPFCGINGSVKYTCQNSSIEGVRRLFPTRKLLPNSLQINHAQSQRSIDAIFSYTECMSPTLIKILPSTAGTATTISNASRAISGSYTIDFDGIVYPNIPAAVTANSLTSLLQSFSNFGYVAVNRTGECHQYSYRIEWLINGEQPLIAIVNSTQVRPINAPITVSSIRRGSSTLVFYRLPTDVMRTHHTNPQIEVLVGGFAAYCSNENNTCALDRTPSQTPQITMIVQSNTVLTIHGNGFDTNPQSNIVSIGESGQCAVQTCTATTIVCGINNSPSGYHELRVNVLDKGLASNNGSSIIFVPMWIDTFNPNGGDAGGGYRLTIRGGGFSSFSRVAIGNNPCVETTLIDYATLQCTVPPSATNTLSPVSITITDRFNSTTSSNLFTYNSTTGATIYTINPTYVGVRGGLLSINGTGFVGRGVSVFIGAQSVRVLAATNDAILVNLTAMEPGLYPITVRTIVGYAQPMFHVEYRFYVQEVVPQVGSAYGGTDLYVHGVGFDNDTRVRVRDHNNRTASCNIVRVQSDQIHCRTTFNNSQIVITSYGSHPSYGFGYSWNPIREIVRQGTIVTWYWDSTQLLSPVSYKVQQVNSMSSNTATQDGFDSGTATTIGSFSYQFDEVGTYYYWSPNVHPSSGYSMRGVIEVLPLESGMGSVEVFWNTFNAQKCKFPFTFNGVTFSSCTSMNDTRSWCSPTRVYNGQRLYCTPTASIPPSSCTPAILNATVCNQSAPSTSEPTDFLSTTCGVDSVLTVSPLEGGMGTELTIRATHLTGNICDYAVQIGQSYLCPVTNISSNEIKCRIGPQSMLDPREDHLVRILRYHQGYLENQHQLRFKFLPSITSVTPTMGSIHGGTQVKITGDGFMSEETLLMIQGTSFAHLGSTSYSEINFQTPQELSFTNMNMPIQIYVRFTEALCLLPSCHFSWESSITPSFTSVNRGNIRGTTNLTLSGQNFLASGSNNANVSITIGNTECMVNHITNISIDCTIAGVKAGVHEIKGYIGGVGNIFSPLNITSDAYLSTASPLESGTNGGAVLRIDGNGFTDNERDIEISVGNHRCPVIQAAESEIRCRIPRQGNSSSMAAVQIISHNVTFPSTFVMNYSQSITPDIASISPTFGNGTQTITISGSNLAGTGQSHVEIGDSRCNITSSTSTSITCTVDQFLSAGNHSVVVNVDNVGDSNDNVTYTHDLTLQTITPSESGYGGGVSARIRGNGLNGTDVHIKICNQSCSSLRRVSNGELICDVPSMNVRSQDTICNVSVNVNGRNKDTEFAYRVNLTTTITSVSPNRGGTGGGTLITITGTGFPASILAVNVSIAGVPCEIQTLTPTRITCETGSYSQSSTRAPIMVAINGSGNAAGSTYFQYIDLWSSTWTWGGLEPPEEGTLVIVENQQTVYLDIKTPKLKVLVIDNASLIFEDSQDVALNAEYIILINGGRIQVGSETAPFEHRAEINLHGHLRSIELPIYGAKVLAIREGILEMHGMPTVRTWTSLGATAANGSTAITLSQAVNWTVGDQIVIATTSDRFSQKESEVRRISNISSNGLILTLDRPLTYTHLGLTHTVNSVPLEMRAEVGLLSHNVIFQGSVTETWDQIIEPCPDGFNPDEFAIQTCFLGRYGQEIGSDEFGAMIMVSPETNVTNRPQQIAVRLSNVEIYHVGQAFRLDRYAIHFQRAGNMSQSYIKSCSIHESYNRAVHFQATHHITIENNVIYNVMGNALYLSDGVEIGHVFRRNLAVFVRTSSSLMNEDLTPAAFWLSNPNNIVEFNAIAGCTHYGYWYRFGQQPEEASVASYPNYCPNNQPFGRFFGNSAHSTGRFGVWMYPEYAPTLSGSCNGTDSMQAVLDGLISWRNNKGIELVMSRTVQIKNALVFDNADMGIGYITADHHQDTNPSYIRPTFYQTNNGSSVVDSIIIGDSGITSNPVVPKTGGLIVMWDRGLHVHNVVFINFPSNQTRAIYGPIILDRCTDRCGGWLTKFSNISFVNVLTRGSFRWSYDALYYDEDGSLSGQPDSVIMAADGLTNTTLACTAVTAFENAIKCPYSMGSWLRFSFHEILERPLGRLFVYDSYNASTIVPWLPEQLTYPNGYLVVLLANQTYKLHFDSLTTPDTIRYTGVIYDVAPGDYIVIQHSMIIGPFKANTTIDRQMILGSPTPLSGTNSSNGDWYYDQYSRLFSYIVKNPSTANSSVDIVLSYQLYFCPCNSCGCPLSTTTSTTTVTTSSATTATTTSSTSVTTTSVTTTTTTSVTTTTSTSATTVTTTSVTTLTTTTTTTTSATTVTTTRYLQPIQPCEEIPNIPQLCQMVETKRWSVASDWTFGPQTYSNSYGNRPGDNSDIYVPRCIWLIIDHPLPRIRSLKIEGVVQFQPGLTHRMYVDNIIINGGRLIAGTPTVPFNSSLDIIMTNTSSPTIQLLPTITRIEPKMIVVYGGLDLHGLPQGVTWTRLAMTATSNQNRLVLSQPISWAVGDEIIITTTDIDITHTERHRIASIQNSTVIFTVSSLSHTHRVIRKIFPNGRTVNVAAAVGLLTRNVRIIGENPGSSTFGFRIYVGSYNTDTLHIYSNLYYSTCYKGYLRVSNTQFIGYGQLDDSYNTEQRAAIYINELGSFNFSRETFVRDSAFDGGFNAAVSVWGSNDILITNNVIFNTFRSGLVISGTNNLVQNNLVAKVHWIGSAQIQSVAEFNFNYDAAIMTRDAISVRLLNNLVAGVERLAYRVHGESCGDPSIYVPSHIINTYFNNEAHSAMSGVNLWPSDKGFTYDRTCVLIRGFRVYKAWYYGFYINTPRNITMSDCTVVDSHVGIFTYIIGPSALTHVPIRSRVQIYDSLVVGSITDQDCDDQVNRASMNIRYSQMAIPGVADDPASNRTGGRSGIVFPTISRNNFMPIRSWTGVGVYPCLSGLMSIANTTFAFFNNVCNRSDTAIQVSQKNDDGQFPISTSVISIYNSSYDNLIFNGQPNLAVVNPSRCTDMDCDGLKKNLITDTDGSLFGFPSSTFSQSELLWGNQQHGVGDYRIPRVALSNLTGHRINISQFYPYRGISRTNSCSLRSPWGMHMCNMSTDYRMLIIESMDSDTERRRISPVAIMSRSGYIDLINGPQDQTFCNGYNCRKRISTFMGIVQSGETYEIYFSSTPPKHLRFRILNADGTFRCILAVYYYSLQQIDVYSNTLYVPPTNRDLRSPSLMLLDQTGNVSLSSPAGTNFFNRTYQLLYVNVNGNSTVDVRMSPLLILSFGFPPISPSAFFASNLVSNLAALFGIAPERIRRVNIVSASNNTRIRRDTDSLTESIEYDEVFDSKDPSIVVAIDRRIRRQAPSVDVRLSMELRDEPRVSTTASTGIRGELLANIASAIINRYQIGELQVLWVALGITNTLAPTNLTVQEPYDDNQTDLSVIYSLSLVIPPADCRQYSPCTVQPVLIAYDAQGNVIQKLGSNDRPWQIIATIVNQSSVTVYGGTANYTNGQTQYNQLALPDNGTYVVEFNVIQPNGVNGTFFIRRNLTVQTTVVTVTKAILSARQISNSYYLNRNESFQIVAIPIDNATQLSLAKIQWGTWQWSINVSMHNLAYYNPTGSLFVKNGSRTIIDIRAGTITITNLAINGIGMFILGITLTSSDNVYNISITSSAMLLREDKRNLITDVQSFSSNITFAGDYDALNASNQLEITRATVYNYLRTIGMPIASDLVLINGSNGTIIALFEVEPPAINISNAVSTLLTSPNAIPGVSVLTLNINTRTYSIPGPDNSTSTDNSNGADVKLIAGLVAGLGGTGLIVLLVALNYFFQSTPPMNEVAPTSTNTGTPTNGNTTTNIEGVGTANSSTPQIIWFQ